MKIAFINYYVAKLTLLRVYYQFSTKIGQLKKTTYFINQFFKYK